MSKKFLFPLLLAASVTPVWASGYRFGSQSVSAQANADANSAEAADASAQFFNPAALSKLSGSQYQLGGTLVVPQMSYQDRGSTRFTGTPTGGTTPSGFAPDHAIVPTFYLSRALNADLTWGLGVYVPYAAKLNYGSTWQGRYALKSIELASLAVNPSVAWKFAPRQSLGFGLTAEYMKAKLSQAVDVPGSIAALAAAGVGGAVVSAIQAQGGNPAVLASAQDAHAQIKGDGWGYGFNLGYLVDLSDSTRVGLAYRSPISHTLKGDTIWDFSAVTTDPIVNQFLQNSSHKINSDGRVKLMTPETVSANVFSQLNATWAAMADVTWTRNSRLQDLHIEFPGSQLGDEVIRQRWRDTFRVSVGANYRLNERTVLKGGVALDQSPVRSSELTHPALPDGDRTWLSAGLSYKLDAASSVDLAYSYVQFDQVEGNYSNDCSPLSTSCTGNGETTKGLYKTRLQLLGVSYNRKF